MLFFPGGRTHGTGMESLIWRRWLSPVAYHSDEVAVQHDRGRHGVGSSVRARRVRGRQTSQLIELLDQYGSAALRRAILEALARNTPRACSVAFLLRRQPRPALLALDLSPPSASASGRRGLPITGHRVRTKPTPFITA